MSGLPLILEEDGTLEQTKTSSAASSTLNLVNSEQTRADLSGPEQLESHQNSSEAHTGYNYFDKLSKNKQRSHRESSNDLENGDVDLELDEEDATQVVTISSAFIGDNSGPLHNEGEFDGKEITSQNIDDWIQEIERANDAQSTKATETLELDFKAQVEKTKPTENHHGLENGLMQMKPTGILRTQNDPIQKRRPHSMQPHHIPSTSACTSSTVVNKVPPSEHRRATPQATPGERPLPGFSRSATVGVMETRASSRRSTRNGDGGGNPRDDATGGASSALDLIHKYYHSMAEFSFHQADKREAEVFDEKNKNVRLEEHIKLHHLEQLMQEFSQHSPPDILIQEGSGYFPAKVKKRTAGQMNLEEFKEAVFRVLATDEYDEYLEKLFMKLDTSCDGYVDWNEFCTYLLLLYRENDYLRTKRDIPFLVEPKIRHIVHNKQEQTTKIVAVQGPMRYVTISREGAMTVFQPNLVVEKHYVVPDQDDEQKRRFKMWVTDAIYMKNCQKIAIGSTSRDIRFYDVSSSHYFEEYHLFAMSDVPYCFDYFFNPQNANSESILVFGVDSGAIHLLTFMKPVTQLFETPFKNQGGVQKIFMQEIEQHSQWVKHLVLPEIHPEIIRQVRYLPDNRAIISSSGCPKNTLVICDVLGTKKSYVFRMEKGVECFDHSKDLNLLATGSGDHLVRLWNPYVTNKPVAILSGHHTGVIGVAIHEGFKQVFSYSKDAVIKVWDTKEHTCLQTVVLKFPSSIHGRMPEHGQFPVHLQDGRNSAFVVTCNDYIGSLRLGRKEEKDDTSMEVTHSTQLCSAIYNKFLKQVVTGCDSSTIAVWDIETGNKSIVFSNAHGDEEITCMAFDSTNRRLISGARNGSVKVWNFQNGHNLHKLEPVEEAEVTGILQLPDKKVFLTVGWNQKIVTYDDKDADSMYIPANTCWKGGQPHQDDILSADFAPPNFLATAGYDGEIIVWEIDSEKIYVRLRKGQPPNISKKLEALKTKVPGMSESTQSSRSNSRPNSRHRSSHRVVRGQPAPVDKLLFLKARASIRFTESAILISSEGGILRWWNIYSQHREMGYFYVPSIPDESVLAMCSKPNDGLLITGDTQGMVQCWDIMDYCTKNDGHCSRSAPPLEAVWKAHDSAIVSVEYIQHDAGTFILTASTDKTARLWSPDGHYIGTFGQKEPWHLKTPSTWAHPKTPWSKDEENSGKVKAEENGLSSSDQEVEHLNVTPGGGQLLVTEREPTSISLASPRLGSRENSYTHTMPPPAETSRSLTLAREGTAASARSSHLGELPHNYHLNYRSHTFALGFHRADRSKTFLGIKVEQDLERRQKDRRGRRVQFGEISVQSTSRIGKQCSPFHALTTPDWQEVKLPEEMPLSKRMQDRGYTGRNLTVEYIKAMDFSYGIPETPLTATPKPLTSSSARGLTPGHPLSSSSSRREKSGKLPPIRSGRVRLLPSSPGGKLKKSSTTL